MQIYSDYYFFELVKLLQFHSNTMSYWSSGIITCFPPKGAAVHAPGVQPALWNLDYLLAPSRYIGDPDLIDHWPRPRLRAHNGKLH